MKIHTHNISYYFLSRFFQAVVLILFFGLLLTGCASRQVKEARELAVESYEIQNPIQIRNSKNDNRPEWTKIIMSEEDSRIYFTGIFLDGSDYAVSIRCAYAEALKALSQSISQFIRIEFTEYVQGDNSGVDGIDRWLSDGLAAFVNNLHIQGARQRQVYYEEKFSPVLMATTYDVFLRVEISKSDYLAAKTRILQNLHDRFSEKNHVEAKKKAEKLLEDLKLEGADAV